MAPFAISGPTELTDKHIAVINIILDNFELISVSHMLNGTLDISEYGLEEQVLLLHDLFFVKQFLHGLMITLLSIEGEVLQLLLVLPVVQYGLREHDILIDLSVEVSESGPLLGVDLHDIEHHAVFHLLLGVK